jgi:hypothetical protein
LGGNQIRIDQKIINFTTLLVIGFLCYLPQLHAIARVQNVDNESGVGSPINTFTTDTMDKGSWGVSERADYYNNRTFSYLKMLADPVAEGQSGYFVNYLMINYGLTDNLTIGGTLPYSSIRNLQISNGENSPLVTHLGNSSGVTNANMYALWRLVDYDTHPLALALLLGVNTPTGANKIQDNTGALFPTSYQPATGAWAPMAGVVFSKYWKKIEISSNMLYIQNTLGTQNTILGSLFDYNFALVYELYTSKKTDFNINGVLELNGEYAGKNKTNGIKDPYSGGNSIFLLPGLRANVNDTISLYSAVTIPLNESYNGSQVKTYYGVITGIDISLG